MRHGLARKNVIRIAVGIIALLLFFFLSPFGTIAAGERGVHLRFTAVTGKVFGEGLYFRFPLIESVQMMDVKVQKYEMKSDAASEGSADSAFRRGTQLSHRSGPGCQYVPGRRPAVQRSNH